MTFYVTAVTMPSRAYERGYKRHNVPRPSRYWGPGGWKYVH